MKKTGKGIMLVLGVLLTYFVGTAAYHAKLNYDGYCIPEHRILSDDEMIRIALKDVNRERPKYVYSYSTGKKERVQEDYIPYASIDELLEKNPNCCSFGLRSHLTSEGRLPPPTFFARINGLHRGYVRYKFEAHYVNAETGEEYSKEYNGSYKIKNCGKIYN